MKIVKTRSGYGVLDEKNNTLIIQDESMGVCDSIVFARNYPDVTEGAEILENYENKRKEQSR